MSSRIVADAVHLPFLEQPAGADFRWRLGVRPLDPADWFEWGETADAAIAAKPGLVADHGDVVFATLGDIEPEATELAAMIVDHLATHQPDRNRTLDPTLHPLDAAARLVPDDLVLLVERDGGLVFGGGSVCFPNRWDLRSKLGLPIAEVHAPVAQLNEQIGHAIDVFFDRLVPDRSWWRLGWGIIDTDDWYAPDDGTPPGHDGPVAAGRWFLRVERESLRRLPATNAVAFGIRTHLTSLDALDADTRSHLAARVARLPDDVADYKDVATVRERLVADLAAS